MPGSFVFLRCAVFLFIPGHGLMRGLHLDSSDGVAATLTTIRGTPLRIASFAVIQPFWLQELPKLMAQNWTALCDQGPAMPVDLVLYFAGSKTDRFRAVDETTSHSLEDVLTPLADVLPLTMDRCFHSIRVAYGHIPVTTSYPQAPCLQFFNMFKQAPAAFGYTAFYQMELDVHPMRADWLSVLLPLLEEASRGDAWVIGGTYNAACMKLRGQDKHSFEQTAAQKSGAFNDNHINGNAIYSSHPDFVGWLRQRDICGAGGYDVNLWTRARTSQLSHKWRQDVHFMDCKPTGVHATDHVTMSLDELRTNFPHVVLVHASHR